MKRAVPILLLIAAVVIGVLVFWRRPDPTPSGSSNGSSARVANGSGPTERAPRREHTAQVGSEERKRLAEQIAAAHAARGVHSTASRPKLPDEAGSDDVLSRVQDHVQKALQEAIPFLAACYEQTVPPDARAGITTFAMMTLTTDPDIGTVVDADQIFDDKHQPIPKALDDCLRNTMQTLALPPLDSDDPIRIQYSFRFE